MLLVGPSSKTTATCSTHLFRAEEDCQALVNGDVQHEFMAYGCGPRTQRLEFQSLLLQGVHQLTKHMLLALSSHHEVLLLGWKGPA